MRTNKKVRASLLTLILAFFAIGTIAIAKEVMKRENPINDQKNLVMYDWNFTGSDPRDPTHYTKDDPLNPETCPDLEETICKIHAPEDSGGLYPNLTATVSGSTTVVDQIDEALASLLTPSPTLNATVKGFGTFN